MFFYNSLYEYRKLITVNNIGIVGTTLNVYLDCETKADGVLIMDSLQTILINTVKLSKVVEVLQGFVRTITKHNLNIDNNYLEIDKDNLIVLIYFYATFSFITVSKKLQVIDKKLMKLYLQFIRNSFFNFVGNSNNSVDRSWKYLCKLYEVFFLEYLSKKFYAVLTDILSYEDNLIKDQEKLKNVYLVELPQNHIQQRKHSIIVTSSVEQHKTCLLLDLRKLWRKKRRKKLFVISNDIWQYILYMIQQHNEAYSIKMEFFSTFPRLNVVGKFLKVGNGYAMIELYEVNKLSRHATKYCEYEMTIHKHSNHNEHAVSNNSSSNNNKNYFMITRNIEMFVKEYFSCIHNSYCVYTAISSCLLYFDIDMLSSIDDALYMRLSFEGLVSFLYRKLKSILTTKTATTTTTVIANNKQNNANAYNNKSGMISCLEIQKGFIYNVLFENGSSCVSMNNTRIGFEKGLSFVEKSVIGFSRQLSKIAVDVGNLDNTILCNISELGLNEIPDISEYNDYSFNLKEFGNSFGNNGSNLNIQSKPAKKKMMLQKRNTLFNIGRDKDYSQTYMVDKKDKYSILKDIQSKLSNYEVNGMVSGSNNNNNNNGRRGGDGGSNSNNNCQTDLKFTKMKTCQVLNNAVINNVKQLDEEDYCGIIKK